ncbi:hypothetical protein ASE00_06575 [Sphingomonas sp. Root710]|uniref:hypothetical protein n=1 Tax=Sphingomonas sp. Root710 TaxID=1736594 RepID=UPI0006FE1496|nr:hypothetical protein [Sphingomonas sp. Root710]KRB86913.1 hypothetical protein ASE00_06575 [Sphingomonas sp. Root710]
MLRPLLIVTALLALSACGKEEAPADTDPTGEPQIATSLDDYALPVDRSGQVTAIDATTGDASGMPKDGGAVVAAPKPEPRPEVAAPADNAAAAAPSPLVAMPPPAAAPAPAAPVTAGD